MFGQGFKISAVLVILLFVYSGCVSTIYITPDEVIKTNAQEIVIHMKDGDTFTLHKAQLKNDKLTGFDSRGVKTEVDVTHIQSVILKKANYYFVVLYGVAAFVAAGLIIGAATAPSPPPTESCPFIYSFDGNSYVFEAEPYGGAICRALKRSEWCSLDNLKERDSQYKILIANELDETEYTDELKLLVVDHPQGTKAVPDALGGIHTISHPIIPLQAKDKRGQDILPLISKNDDLFWESQMEGSHPPDKEDLKEELIFEFPKPSQAKKAKLLVNAWTSLWGSQVAQNFLELYGYKVNDWISEVNRLGREYAWVRSWYIREQLYLLQVQAETGNGWKPKGMIYGGGPFVAKDKCYVIDISDVPGERLKIKLTPPVGFWRINALRVDYSEDAPIHTTEVGATRAFDQNGRDVRESLAAADNDFLVMPHKGDSAEVIFQGVPLSSDRERSLILKVTGYYDIHLEAKGEPNLELIEKIHSEPGFTIQYALQEYWKMRQAQGAKRGQGKN
jgi:hypothetical protein